MTTLEGLIPPIRRARDYYLYTVDGKRLIDLYRFGGAALLGYRPDRLVTAQKSRLAEGLAAPLPSLYPARLVRLLAQRFPGHPHVRIFRDRDRALGWLAGAGYAAPIDPAFGAGEPPVVAGSTNRVARSLLRVALWRPYLPVDDSAAVLLPVLPDPSGFAPQAVCFADEPPDGFQRDAVSAVALAGAVRACGLVQVAEAERRVLLANPAGRRHPPQRPRQVIAEWELGRHCGTVWQARGPYLTTGLDSAAYHRLFERYLSEGILIAPTASEPTVLPMRLTPGEFILFTKSGTITKGELQ